MHLKPTTSLTFLALGSALLFAAGWEKKDFSQWTEKDVQKILTNSPWTKEARIPLGGPSAGAGSMPAPSTPPTAPPSGGGGGTSDSSGSSGGGGTSGGGAPQAGGGGGGMASPETPTAPVLVQWVSATPVRLAQLKSQASEKAPSQTDIDTASKPTDAYVIAVIGLPKGMADPQSLQKAASLTPKKKEPIHSTQVKVQPMGGGGEAYVFSFPKSTPLATEDKDVEFRLEAGKLEIKKKFSLKDMQYQGNLAI